MRKRLRDANVGAVSDGQRKALVAPREERWKPQKRESQSSQRYGQTKARRNQMRSTKPRLVDRRTALLAQVGHSRIFLANVSFMRLKALQKRY
jgi:hypothetical protein